MDILGYLTKTVTALNGAETKANTATVNVACAALCAYAENATSDGETAVRDKLKATANTATGKAVSAWTFKALAKYQASIDASLEPADRVAALVAVVTDGGKRLWSDVRGEFRKAHGGKSDGGNGNGDGDAGDGSATGTGDAQRFQRLLDSLPKLSDEQLAAVMTAVRAEVKARAKAAKLAASVGAAGPDMAKLADAA